MHWWLCGRTERAEALAKQQMLPTLGPAHRQLIHVYNYDDTTGKPNPTGVLAFINEVIFAVETMHQDLAFRTFDRSVGAQHLTMDLPYYQPPYAADAYPHPLFVASTLERFFAQMSIISHSREENLADNFLAAFSANRASFKNALRPDFGIHTVTSPILSSILSVPRYGKLNAPHSIAVIWTGSGRHTVGQATSYIYATCLLDTATFMGVCGA